MSLLFFGLLAAHIAVAVLLAVVLIRWARRHGRVGWKFGVPIVVASFLVVFWDVVPTAAVHSYLCSTQAGVTIYKDANVWVAEHPVEAKSVRPFLGESHFRVGEFRHGYWLNSQFYVDIATTKIPFLPVFVRIESVRDANRSAALLEHRSVHSGYLKGNDTFTFLYWLKGWVGLGRCGPHSSQYENQFRLYSDVNIAKR